LPLRLLALLAEYPSRIVENLGAQCIIGSCFLIANGVHVDYASLRVSTQYGTSPFVAVAETHGSLYAVTTHHRVSVARTIKPNARVNMVVAAPPDMKTDTPVLVEPSPAALHRGLIASRTVLVVRAGRVFNFQM
jgi:hypothetical protein